MLRGGGEKQFSRQMSKKDTVKALNLSKQISESNIPATAVLSSRRTRICTPGSPENPILREEDEEQTAVNPES